MKGVGEIRLSTDNLVDAVQQWLDQRWTADSPVVKEVKLEWDTASSGYIAIIKIESNKSFVGAKES